MGITCHKRVNRNGLMKYVSFKYILHTVADTFAFYRKLLQEPEFPGNEPDTESHSKESAYVNSDVSDGSLGETKRPKSSVYDSVQGDINRQNSLDSSSYERVSFIRRSSSIHDYQYVDNKRKDILSNDVYGSARQSVALENIDEEENENEKQYVNLQDEKRSPSGTNYQSLGFDWDIKDEGGIKKEIEQGFYQNLSNDAIEKYTKLSPENQNELGAQLEKPINSHEQFSESADADPGVCSGQQGKSDYIYLPDYLALIHDGVDCPYDDPKKEQPIKYLNAEKSPGYMACITELKKKDKSR